MHDFKQDANSNERPTLPPIRAWFAEELSENLRESPPQLRRSLEQPGISPVPTRSTSLSPLHTGTNPHHAPLLRPCISHPSGSSPRHQLRSLASPIGVPPAATSYEEHRLLQSRNIHRELDDPASTDVGTRTVRVLSTTPVPQYNYPSRVPNTSYQGPVNPAKTSPQMFRSSPPTHSDLSIPDNDALEAQYECPHCGKGFSRPSSLKIHLNSHTGEKPFVCPIEDCGRSFSVLSNMRRHARMHSPQYYLDDS